MSAGGDPVAACQGVALGQRQPFVESEGGFQLRQETPPIPLPPPCLSNPPQACLSPARRRKPVRPPLQPPIGWSFPLTGLTVNGRLLLK
jgi:hypothetical protein